MYACHAESLEATPAAPFTARPVVEKN